MALHFTSPQFSLSSRSKFSLFHLSTFRSISIVELHPQSVGFSSGKMIKTTPFCMKVEEGEKKVLEDESEKSWGKVSAVLFDMDGVLCNSEEPSRRAAVDLFTEMGVDVTVDDFVPFMGTESYRFQW
ncbi:Protein SUPPRESSOR OF QUENCHING 1 chloroplastic [Bienertia sinuspersici]